MNQQQQDLCKSHNYDFTELKAVILNCTLERSPEPSHTEALLEAP